jgi:hypothetical protein
MAKRRESGIPLALLRLNLWQPSLIQSFLIEGMKMEMKLLIRRQQQPQLIWVLLPNPPPSQLHSNPMEHTFKGHVRVIVLFRGLGSWSRFYINIQNLKYTQKIYVT